MCCRSFSDLRGLLFSEESRVISAFKGRSSEHTCTMHRSYGKMGGQTLRIFLSSTFRDMNDERDIFLRRHVPVLRQHCADLGLFLSIVDLRWGVTVEQAQVLRPEGRSTPACPQPSALHRATLLDERSDRSAHTVLFSRGECSPQALTWWCCAQTGEVVPICMSEVENCQYFACFLGARYGWAPKRKDVPEFAFDRFDFLNSYIPSRSVTECECICAWIRTGTTRPPQLVEPHRAVLPVLPKTQSRLWSVPQMGRSVGGPTLSSCRR
jgi:hypothetical protein